MSPLLFLVPLLPHEAAAPFPGQRVRWPGHARDLVWDGQRWVEEPAERPFDGGDAWLRSEW